MDRIRPLLAFVQVVRFGSLSAAAQASCGRLLSGFPRA